MLLCRQQLGGYMNKPLVSIIIPIYNVEKYLDRCIKTIVDQTYNNLEIILVDDGSPDNSLVICEKWEKQDNRIRVIHKENGGVSSARNIGLEIATGEYISFIDPDDIIHPNYYDILMSQIGNADCIICSFKKFSNEIEFENRYIYTTENMNSMEAIKRGFFNNSDIFYVVWNKIIKTDIAKKQRFNEEMKNGEDSLFAYNVIISCNEIKYTKAPLYGYYIREDGAVNTIDSYGKMNQVELTAFICKPYMNDKDKAFRRQVKSVFAYKMCSAFSFLKNNNEKEKCKIVKKHLKHNIDALIMADNLTIKEKIYTIMNIFV